MGIGLEFNLKQKIIKLRRRGHHGLEFNSKQKIIKLLTHVHKGDQPDGSDNIATLRCK